MKTKVFPEKKVEDDFHRKIKGFRWISIEKRDLMRLQIVFYQKNKRPLVVLQ